MYPQTSMDSAAGPLIPMIGAAIHQSAVFTMAGESQRGNDPCLIGGSLVTQVFRAVITIMVGTVR